MDQSGTHHSPTEIRDHIRHKEPIKLGKIRVVH